MGKRNARNKIKKSYLEEINYIDRRIKRFKNNEDKVRTLTSKRKLLTNKLKTKR